MDVTPLAASGATAIISAMANDAWAWARSEIARLLGRGIETRERDEVIRLDTFARELHTTAERDVHNRLHGYLEARLGDDTALQAGFVALVQNMCAKLGIEPPANLSVNSVSGNHNTLVNAAGHNVQVTINQPRQVIQWMAMTNAEAARVIEQMDLAEAREAIVDMEPTSAAHRLAHMSPQRARDLLANINESAAADLLSMMPDPDQATALLVGMAPVSAAAILDLSDADWAVARLADMDTERAQVLLAATGTKRQNDLVAAMERQRAVSLLSGLVRVIADQARNRKTFDQVEREAERITRQAKVEADAIRRQAQREKERLEAAVVATTGESSPQAGLAPAEGTVTAGVAVLSGRPRHAVAATVAALAPPGMALPFDFFLLSHNSAGRARLEQSNLESGVAAAVLIELIRGGHVRLDRGQAVPAREATDTDPPLEATILAQPVQSVHAWIRRNRKELFLNVAQHVVDTGIVVPVRRVMSNLLYKPVDESVANEPAVRVMRHLLHPTTRPDESTYLLIALIDVTQLHAKLPAQLKTRQIRDLLRQVLDAQPSPPYLRDVCLGLDAAIAINTTMPARRT